MKKTDPFLILFLGFIIIVFLASSCNPVVSLPYAENFTANNGGFVFVNSAQPNQWFHGNAVGNPPNSIYISNTSGSSNAYTINGGSVSHTYKEISIPGGTGISNLSFDWRGAGENLQDYLKVWLVPSSYTPVAGTPITAGGGRVQLGGYFNQQSEWQTYLNDNLSLVSFAGSNMRIVFEWTNNSNSGLQPPASVDNILITACRIPSGMSVPVIMPNAATLSWIASPSSPANGYEYYLSSTNVPPAITTAPTGTSGTTSVNVAALSSNTTYYWWVRSVCTVNDKSPWIAGPSFTTMMCNISTPVVSINSVTHNSAAISWPKNDGVSLYTVRYKPVGTANWTVMNVPAVVSPSTINILNLTGNLLPATLYEIEVAAECDGIKGAYSHNEFSTKCDPTPPGITISSITTNSAVITWSPLAASSSYIIRYREIGTPIWTNVTNIPSIPGNTYTLVNLAIYTTYEVQVASICNGEVTPNPYSSPKTFTTARTCELPPSGLTITDLTTTTAVVGWDPFPGATYILRYRKVGIPSWTTVAVSTNIFSLTGLLELTEYEMQVVNVCSGILGTYTPSFFFTTPTIIHCPVSSGSGGNEFISKVTVKPNGKPVMENTSTGSIYTDYTGSPAQFIELIQGSTGNEISIEKSWLGVNNDEGVAVWIDFDRNGYFDINERILAWAPNTTTPVKGTFNVPSDAFISLTDHKYIVMRVAMQRGAIPVNCTNFDNGEVEDYTVKISKLAIANTVNQTDILIYPNPVSSILYVKNISPKADYKIYNGAGQLISKGIILDNKINVSGLIHGVYVIDVEDVKGVIQKKFIKEK